jgi:sugar phosphate isomerase/epimerase
LPLNPEELVINLASEDREIRFHSANHLRELIQLTAQTGGRWFSFHAGFSADPVPDSLGRRWVLMNKPLPLSDAYERYWEEVARLAQFARESGVSLLIENNILTAENLDAIGPDVLLLANPEDILMHSEALPTGVSLLIDVAHLEVSARVFRSDESRKVLNSPAVRAYHFSNTNGDFDTGEVLTGKEAFWAHIHGGSAYATLEIRSNDVSTLQAQLRLVEQLMTK